MSQGKTIGIFGGTFNPVHNGHFSIVKSFLGNKLINELWMLLTPTPPHKKGEPIVSYTHRMNMLELVFGSLTHVKISDVENELPNPSYTIQTIDYLLEEFPEYSFLLCIGEDSLAHFKSWHKWEDILERVNLLVASRPGFELSDDDALLKKHATFVDHYPIKVSSTELRKKISAGKDVKHLMPDTVFDYITEHNLYKSTHK